MTLRLSTLRRYGKVLIRRSSFPDRLSVDIDDDGHCRVPGRAAVEQAGAAATEHQFLDQLDDEPQPGRPLWMAPHQRTAVVVQPPQFDAECAAEGDVVHHERVVRLDHVDLANR